MNESDTTSLIQHREVHTFVVRAGRMTVAERKNYSELSPVWCLPYTESPLDFKTVFGNSNPVTVEIGFGMGQATAIIAAEHPDKNYLGLEVHTPGIGRLLGEIKDRGLKNTYIIAHDAIEVLTNMIQDNSVDAFHIFFPDPWPKLKHHKRRLVQRPRTDLFAKKLKNGGYLYMATDWLPYAQFSLKELTATDGLENKFEGFAPHQEWRPETRFEAKGLDANRVISELFFLRNSTPVSDLKPIVPEMWNE